MYNDLGKIKCGFCMLFYLFLINNVVYGQPFGYEFAKTITIDHNQVSGSATLNNFPLYFHIIDPDLRTKGNGGNVYNPNGFDIVFTTSDCSFFLNHEIEKYDSLTGELICWVNIPVLSATTNTEIQMYYGNLAVDISTSTSATWTNQYSTVLHLSQSPAISAPQITDATGGGNNGTCLGTMTAGNKVPAKLGDGIYFDEVDDRIVIPDYDYTASFTVSFWFQIPELAGNSFQYLFSHGAYGVFESVNIYLGESALAYTPDRGMLKTIFQDSNDATSTSGLDAGTTYGDGLWHFYTLVIGNSGGAWVYVDGVEKAYLSYQGGNAFNPVSDIFLGCRSDLNATRFLGGYMDEVRILNEPLSEDWIITEFNNQNAPSSFYSVGLEQPSTILCITLPVTLIDFTASLNEQEKVEVKWSVYSETNSDYYTVERSVDAINFYPVAELPANNISSFTSYYQIIDEHPLKGITYYRLKQTDLNGANQLYHPVEVYFNHSKEELILFPNPVANQALLFYNSQHDLKGVLKFFDEVGKIVRAEAIQLIEGSNQISLDLSDLSTGIYYVRFGDTTMKPLKLVKL